MLFLLKKILTSFILPPTSLLILGFFGLGIARKHPRTGKGLVVFSLSATLVLSLPVTGNALLQNMEAAPPISQAQLRDTQAIVVLGGGKNNEAPEFNNEDTVNHWTLQRLRYGAYLQQITGKPILVTGGAPFGGRPEADVMAESLQRDFHAKTIWIENQSKDTAENATYSASLLKEHGITRIALVSQAWHLPRAIKLFEQQGITIYPAPTGYTQDDNEPILKLLPNASALNKSSLALKEYLGQQITK